MHNVYWARHVYNQHREASVVAGTELNEFLSVILVCTVYPQVSPINHKIANETRTLYAPAYVLHEYQYTCSIWMSLYVH